MSDKKSRFGQIKSRSIKANEMIEEAKNKEILETKFVEKPQTKAAARIGKKAIVGYFSEELSREFYSLAIKEGKTMQALLGEAIDDLLRTRGINPYGER